MKSFVPKVYIPKGVKVVTNSGKLTPRQSRFAKMQVSITKKALR